MNIGSFGDKIQDLVIQTEFETGKSQEVQANEIGISSQLISKCKNGDLPQIKNLIGIAQYYNVSLDDLLGITPQSSNDIMKCSNVLKLDISSIKKILSLNPFQRKSLSTLLTSDSFTEILSIVSNLKTQEHFFETLTDGKETITKENEAFIIAQYLWTYRVKYDLQRSIYELIESIGCYDEDIADSINLFDGFEIFYDFMCKMLNNTDALMKFVNDSDFANEILGCKKEKKQ